MLWRYVKCMAGTTIETLSKLCRPSAFRDNPTSSFNLKKEKGDAKAPMWKPQSQILQYEWRHKLNLSIVEELDDFVSSKSLFSQTAKAPTMQISAETLAKCLSPFESVWIYLNHEFHLWILELLLLLCMIGTWFPIWPSPSTFVKIVPGKEREQDAVAVHFFQCFQASKSQDWSHVPFLRRLFLYRSLFS